VKKHDRERVHSFSFHQRIGKSDACERARAGSFDVITGPKGKKFPNSFNKTADIILQSFEKKLKQYEVVCSGKCESSSLSLFFSRA